MWAVHLLLLSVGIASPSPLLLGLTTWRLQPRRLILEHPQHPKTIMRWPSQRGRARAFWADGRGVLVLLQTPQMWSLIGRSGPQTWHTLHHASQPPRAICKDGAHVGWWQGNGDLLHLRDDGRALHTHPKQTFCWTHADPAMRGRDLSDTASRLTLTPAHRRSGKARAVRHP